MFVFCFYRKSLHVRAKVASEGAKKCQTTRFMGLAREIVRAGCADLSLTASNLTLNVIRAEIRDSLGAVGF